MLKVELLINPTSLFFIFRAKVNFQALCCLVLHSDLFSGKDAAAQWPRYQVSTEEKIKQINHNPTKRSLSLFVLSRLIRKTLSPNGTTALFIACKRKIQPAIQKRAGRQSLTASDLTRLCFGAVSAATSILSLHTRWWNEMTPRSLSETLLYGDVGEDTRELLDDSRVYLWAERDVQEKELWTWLEQLLQGGRTHQAGTCRHQA